MGKHFTDEILKYATKLEGVSNQLAGDLVRFLSASDKTLMRTIQKDLAAISSETELVQAAKRLDKLARKVEKIREKAFKQAEKHVREQLEKTASATSSHGVGLVREFAPEKKIKPLSKKKKKTKEIIDYAPVCGQTIGGWFNQYRQQDLTRILSAITQATNESLTLADIRKKILGTKEQNYSDGVLVTTRHSATMIARTLINGVANNSRMELCKENADDLDGVQFVATLDGKTSFICASLDGTIWKPNEMDKVRRPPLHPNCRSTLIPYIEIKDENGNVIEMGERSAAEADFDAEAKKAYDLKAREKGWKRRWEDLSPTTRDKYHYDARKAYTERTGKPPYRQVSGATNFRDYFEKQPESFKKTWLGETRYQLYTEGKLKINSLVKSDTGHVVSVEALKSQYGETKQSPPIQTPAEQFDPEKVKPTSSKPKEPTDPSQAGIEKEIAKTAKLKEELAKKKQETADAKKRRDEAEQKLAETKKILAETNEKIVQIESPKAQIEDLKAKIKAEEDKVKAIDKKIKAEEKAKEAGKTKKAKPKAAEKAEQRVAEAEAARQDDEAARKEAEQRTAEAEKKQNISNNHEQKVYVNEKTQYNNDNASRIPTAAESSEKLKKIAPAFDAERKLIWDECLQKSEAIDREIEEIGYSDLKKRKELVKRREELSKEHVQKRHEIDDRERLAAFDIIFPNDHEDSPNRTALRNKKIDLGKDSTPEHDRHVREGLDLFGRMVDNLGLDITDKLDELTIAGGGKFRNVTACFEIDTNTVRTGTGDAATTRSTTIHELFHWLEEKAHPEVKEAFNEYYRQITTDEKGKQSKLKKLNRSKNSPLIRKASIKVSNEYALREYETGNHELLQVFVEDLYYNPQRIVKAYPEFFDGCMETLKNAEGFSVKTDKKETPSLESRKYYPPRRKKGKPFRNEDGFLDFATKELPEQEFELFINGGKEDHAVEVEWINKLSNEEKQAIRKYTGVGYRRINRCLRGEKITSKSVRNKIQQDITRLDKAILKFPPLQDDIVLYRRDLLSVFVPENEMLDERSLDKLKGIERTEKGFWSTASREVFKTQEGEHCVLEIHLPKGSRGAYVNKLSEYNDKQWEFLIKRNQRYIIKDIDYEGKVPAIIVEVLKND